NGATDGRLEIQRSVLAFRNRGKLDAVSGRQGLVGSYDRLSGRERRLDRSFWRIAGTAEQLPETVNGRLPRRCSRVGKQFPFPDLDAAILGAGARADCDNFDGPTATRAQRIALARDLGNQGGTDRAQSGDTDF